MASRGNQFNDYSYLLEFKDFAVRKEQQAAEFYTSLAGRVQIHAVAVELRKLAAMEEDHRTRLETLNVADVSGRVPPMLEGIQTADYIADAEPTPDMSLPDLLRVAIRRENASLQLYSDMADSLPDSRLKQLLQNLAGDEMQHREYLEKLLAEQY